MEKLTTEQKADVKKMSTERLRLKLGKAGYDEDTIETMDRTALVNEYVEYLSKPHAAAAEPQAVGGSAAAELELRKQELKLRQEELEWRKWDADRDRQERADRENRERKDREDREAREAEWRTRDLQLRDAERVRQEQRDAAEEARRGTLAGQTKHFGEAMRHALPKMYNDPSELPGYFKAVENLFAIYDVPEPIQSKLLIPLLTEKAKALVARLPVARLNKYVDVRDFLLREFRLSAEQYRYKFQSTTKQVDETYTLFGAKLKKYL